MLAKRGLKMAELQIIATPTSLQFVAEQGNKLAIIDINVAASYKYACDRIYYIKINVDRLSQAIKSITNNSVSFIQIYLFRDHVDQLQLETKEIKDGPSHSTYVLCDEFEVLDTAPSYKREPQTNPDGATFRNFEPDEFKKLFKNKSYSDGSGFCDLTITADEVTIMKRSVIGDAVKTSWRSSKNIEIPEGCVIKSILIPHRDIAEYCSKDIKNAVTIMANDSNCRMYRQVMAGEHVEMLFYYCVTIQNDA
jgi:hypothetical protein